MTHQNTSEELTAADNARPHRVLMFFLYVVDNALLATAIELRNDWSNPIFIIVIACFGLVHVAPGLFWQEIRPWIPGPLVFFFCYILAVVPATIIERIADNVATPLAAKCSFVTVCAIVAALLDLKIMFARQDTNTQSVEAT